MTTKDRDNFFSLMVLYDKLTTWKDDKESEITDKDRTKLKIITDTILAMLVQYRKREGETAMNAILTESSNYKFAIIKKDEEMDLSGTFELDIVKSAMKQIAKEATACVLCDKKKHDKCPWFTLHKFVGTIPCNKKKGNCPYKFDESDLFDVEDL